MIDSVTDEHDMALSEPAYLEDRKTLGKDDTERVIISRLESRLHSNVVCVRVSEQPSEAARNFRVLCVC